MGHQNATLADVAAAAGVSLATASRVLNGSTRKVSEGNRELVVAAARRLRYTPNVSAQTVAVRNGAPGAVRATKELLRSLPPQTWEQGLSAASAR